jgi:hypothetical protein
MFLKQPYSFSLNGDRAPQLKASVGRLSIYVFEACAHDRNRAGLDGLVCRLQFDS